MTAFDPSLRSFVPVPADSEFPIQNLPYCAFKRPGEENPRIGVRIGDHLLDLKVLEHTGCFRETPLGEEHVFCKWALNKFMAMGRAVWRPVRERITALLREDSAELRDNAELRGKALVALRDATLCLPVEIGDYTDFYSSRYHAFNVGSMFRGPENALMPNYLWIPVGYHGRAGSIVLSGTPVRRPRGQTKADDAAAPAFGPCRLLDFELEVGFFTGPGTQLGEPIPIDRAEEHIFGLVLVNDWSARDIQKWEYVPLGPFLAKNFATTISPYVVPLDALEPFRCAGPAQDPTPLSYLTPPDRTRSAIDIRLEAALRAPGMDTPQTICRTNFNHLYWSMAQQLAHHTVAGCNIRPGDMMASGTISGPTPDSYGSMLELAWRGERPIQLPGEQTRRFIQDGDTLMISGRCERDGVRIGFGECSGTVLPAIS